MAGWRQAVALAMTGEEIEALTALSRSRTEPAGRVSRAAMRPAAPTARANSSVVAPQPQPMSNTSSPRRGAAKASNASVIGAKVMSVCSCRATQVWPPEPFQKASWSALIWSGSATRVLLCG